MKKRSEPMKAIGVRFDQSKLKQAKKMGIDVSETLRRALDRQIAIAQGWCQTCGTHVKNTGLR
jgi:post-segregation antitoxin (ccd killing protein)